MYETHSASTIYLDGYKVVIVDKNQISLFLEKEQSKSSIIHMLACAAKYALLSVGFAYIARWEKWVPVYLYRFDGGWEMVHYKGSWMCMRCKHTSGPVLIHQSYHDPIFFTLDETAQMKDRIDALFPMRKCPKCGQILNARPLLL